MSKRKKKIDIREPAPGSVPAPGNSDAVSDAPIGDDNGHGGDETEPLAFEQSAEQETQQPESEVERLQAERDEFENKYLRAAADLQNYARRTQQNMNAARQQQLMDVARALLVVLDHFDHALDMDPDTTSTDSLLQGVQIVRDELLNSLERFGDKRMSVNQGDHFDPNCHEAVMRQAVDGIDPDHIAALLQPGYCLADKTLRPAKVSITE